MKIIQLTTFFYPVHGGVEQMVFQLALRLSKDGHKVKVITSDSLKGGEFIRPLTDEINGIKVERCRTWFSITKFHKFFPALLPKLLKSDYDIVHVHGIRKFESYVALFVSKIRKKKVIVSTHNPFVVDPRERSFMENLLIKIHDLTLGKIFFRYFDKFICLSKSEFQELKRFGVSAYKMTKIPNAIPDCVLQKGNIDYVQKRYNFNKNNWDGIVLSLGRIEKRKGIQNLFLAVRELKNVLFLIAGPDDGYLSNLKDLFKGFKNVKLLGEVEIEKTKDLYEICDIFVLPSLYEPFGISLIEAMAKGKVVIATKIGGPSEFVKKDFGFLVDPKNQEEIKEKIKLLIENKKLREKMGMKAREESRKYTWEKIYQMYFKVYKSMLRA